MGEIAEAMINGDMCAECGVWLDAGETVYTQQGDVKSKMPEDGSAFGVPVVCESCHVGL